MIIDLSSKIPLYIIFWQTWHDGRIDGRTDPLIEMPVASKKEETETNSNKLRQMRISFSSVLVVMFGRYVSFEEYLPHQASVNPSDDPSVVASFFSSIAWKRYEAESGSELSRSKRAVGSILAAIKVTGFRPDVAAAFPKEPTIICDCLHRENPNKQSTSSSSYHVTGWIVFSHCCIKHLFNVCKLRLIFGYASFFLFVFSLCGHLIVFILEIVNKGLVYD